MTGKRTKVSVLAVCFLGIVVVAGVVYVNPRAQPETGGSGGAITPSGGCGTVAEAYGNMTLRIRPCVTYGFWSPVMQNATLASKQVQEFIKTAYEYHPVYLANSSASPGVSYVVLNVTGRQVVTGNWSSGYSISYTDNRLLNVTVLNVVGSVYQVLHVSAYPTPQRNDSLAYTSDQDRAIGVAASDPKVESLMGGEPYYVALVSLSGNSTAGQSYVVQFYEVDGPGLVQALVTPGLEEVTGAYSLERFSGLCWHNIVITDPWEAASYAASEATPDCK